jgi:alpha-beta hydrolase superfamily lysophospholipase
MPPSWGAAAILHPHRRHVIRTTSLPHRDVAFENDGVILRGWRFPAMTPNRGVTVVALHGIADNRESAVWIAEQLVPKGFDVLTYDSRANGESGGDACTYGFYEKRDLSRALDQLAIQRAILVGNSLGAAVALQAAVEDSHRGRRGGHLLRPRNHRARTCAVLRERGTDRESSRHRR